MIESIVLNEVARTHVPTNHVVVVDISGSMYKALPELRKHLKENLASLVKPSDSISLIYFSSKGDFGTVFSGWKLDKASDISEIGKLIDRFLQPSGCTGFVEPLKLAIETARSFKTSGSINSLVFMTDGYDNCWSSEEILRVVAELEAAFENTTFIEYGWHCNRELLQKMAESCGGTHVFAEGQVEYENKFESALKTTPKKAIEYSISYDRLLYIENDDYFVVDGVKILGEKGEVNVSYIPESVAKNIWLISDDWKTHIEKIKDLQHMYVLALYGVHKMDSDLVWSALKKTGDVRFIKQFNNCFTKQDYSNFKFDLVEAILDESLRGIHGVDYKMVPDENAPTIIDVLTLLAAHKAQLLTAHPSFSYSRIGRKAIQKEDDTEDRLAEEIAECESKEERKELAKRLATHENWNPEFIPRPVRGGAVDISNLVFNSERPNISIQTVQLGDVPIPVSVSEKYKIPESIETIRWRNYTIVKDGIINVSTLPIVCDDPELINKLKKELKVRVLKRKDTFKDVLSRSNKYKEIFVVDLSNVPLVNRSMVKKISAKECFTDRIHLETLKARQKVLKYFRSEILGAVNTLGLVERYGKDAADFLSEYGIRDYGFSPKTEHEESTDLYMSKELNIKIKGVSSLPSIAAVLKKGNTKLNVADKMIYKEIIEYENFISSPAIAKATENVRKKLIETWIEDATSKCIKEVRELNKKLSRVVYGIVAGRGWFEDLDFEKPTMVVEFEEQEYVVTAELCEKMIKI